MARDRRCERRRHGEAEEVQEAAGADDRQRRRARRLPGDQRPRGRKERARD